MHIVLETGRMLMRRFSGEDAQALAALYGDPRVMRFITPEPPSPAEVKATILPEYLQEYQDLPRRAWLLRGDPETNTPDGGAVLPQARQQLRPDRRYRTRLPAVPAMLGPGTGNRRSAGADRAGIRAAAPRPGCRDHDG